MSWLSLLLATALGQAAPQGPPNVGQDPPRLRTAIPNGAALIVEPAPQSLSLAVHLFAASRGVDESKTSGLRHLLEHLCVKGVDGKLDARLETAGAFLRARTLRDAMDIEVDVPPGKLSLAFDALGEVMRTGGWTPEDIAREAGVIEQESVLQSEDAILTASLWRQAYGGDGYDPMGDPATVKAATPAALEAVRRATFSSANLLLYIVGPIALKEGTAEGIAYLTKLPPGTADAGGVRSAKAGPGRQEVEAFGEARGVPVPSISDPVCVARLCAALAIAASLPDAYVTYTPSALNGMVVVGMVGQIGMLGKFIDDLDEGTADEMLPRAKLLGGRWAAQQVGTPEASARVRGHLGCRNSRIRFENVADAISSLSAAEFRAAIASFGSSHAYVAVGLP